MLAATNHINSCWRPPTILIQTIKNPPGHFFCIVLASLWRLIASRWRLSASGWRLRHDDTLCVV